MVKFEGAVDLASGMELRPDGSFPEVPKIFTIGSEDVPFDDLWQYRKDAMQMQAPDYETREGELECH